MTTLLILLHVLVCIALIIIVLLQAGKGADIGASFGAGSSQTVFGAGGGRSFMTKLTASAAIIFMLTSLTLSYYYGRPGVTSVMPTTVAPPVPDAPLSERLAPIPDEQPTQPTAPAEQK